MRPNQLVSIIGVVLIVIALGAGAILGDRLQPRTTAEGGQSEYQVLFTQGPSSIAGPQGTVADGASMEIALPVYASNLTAVAVTLEWIDSAPLGRPASSVSLSITNSSGADMGSQSGTSTIAIDWEYASAPASTNFTAASDAEAQAHLERAFPAAEDSGDDYTATLTVTRGGPCPPIFGCIRQGNIQYTITIEVTTYSAQLVSEHDRPSKGADASNGGG